jgi:hypothetical protein
MGKSIRRRTRTDSDIKRETSLLSLLQEEDDSKKQIQES